MTVKLKTPSNGSVSLTPQDTAADVVLTVPSGGTGSQLALADSSGYTYSGGLVVSPQTGFKNRIINGGMTIDQRNAGASVTLTAANFVYPVDRFFAGRASGISGAIARRVAGSIPGSNALRVQRNNGDSSTSLLGFGQVIESSNCAGLAGGTITRSFRARCGANFSASGSQITSRIGTGTGTDQSAGLFWNNGWTGQTNSDATITLTTSWQTFSVTTSAGSAVNQVGLTFFWSPTGTAGSEDWVEIEQVQVEKGSVATPFEFRSIGQELALCQRYYYRISGYDTAERPFAVGIQASATSVTGYVKLATTMRSSPTVSANSPSASDQIGWTAAATLNSSSMLPDCGRVTVTFSSNGAQYRPAFILVNTATSWIDFSSEL